MTGSGVALMLLNLLFAGLDQFFGIQVDVAPGQLESWIAAGSEVVAVILMVVGQLRRKDLIGGIVRK